MRMRGVLPYKLEVYCSTLGRSGKKKAHKSGKKKAHKHKSFWPVTTPVTDPTGKTGDRSDRTEFYVKKFYVPFLLPNKPQFFLCPVGLGTTPGLSWGFHRVCRWDKFGENLGQTRVVSLF